LMLLAILERHLHCRFSDRDVFVNIAGGLRVTEPAIDLPVALAILSSRFDVPIPKDVAAFGELGLTGEIRPVPQSEVRVKEAKRLGFVRCLGPSDGKGKREWLTVLSIADAGRSLGLLPSR